MVYESCSFFIFIKEKKGKKSLVDGVAEYKELHTSCLQCIRFLDQLIFSYDRSVSNIRFLNQNIDKIIADNVDQKKEIEK
jgi:hypothetical protein